MHSLNRRMHLDVCELCKLSGNLAFRCLFAVCNTDSSSVCVAHFGCISTGDGSHTGGERCPLQEGVRHPPIEPRQLRRGPHPQLRATDGCP